MEKHFLEYSQSFTETETVYLLGKGPTFSNALKDNIAARNKCIVGLNHVAEQIVCNLTIAIDLNAITSKVKEGSVDIFLPYCPHIKFKPVHDLVDRGVYRYDCSTYKGPAVSFPVIEARFNVAEAAFDILGHLGVKNITSYGVNGGIDYAEEFAHLKPLTNGQSNFNKQLKQIKKICSKHNIVWKKL